MADEQEMLRENLEAQIIRLTQQLDDLQESRGDMTDDEYNELKEDTLEQLREFTCGISKAIANSAAIIAATPSISKMLAEKEPINALKERRNEIERDMKLGKLSLEVGNHQKLEVLTALRRLGCELTDSDKMFIREETSKLRSRVPSYGFNISDPSNGSDLDSMFSKLDDTST